MQIKKIRIRRFRSIKDLTIETNKLSAFCGPNSCGKSNFFKSIQFALKEDDYFTDDKIYNNIIASERDKQGAPLLSIWIDITFDEAPRELRDYADVEDGEYLQYNFRAIRTVTITRKLGEKGPLDRDEGGEELLQELTKHFQFVYVPPIRDLTSGGMEPFRELLAAALQKARGSRSLKSPRKDIEDILEDKASGLLSDHEEFAKKTLGVSNLKLDTSDVSLDKMYKRVSLSVKFGDNNIPLSNIGTGHQSALIIHLFRQLGDQYYD